MSKKISRQFTRREALMLVGAPIALSIVGCGGGGLGSASAPSGAKSASYLWTSSMLDAISVIKPGPPIAARAIGIVHTAIFDAWTAYDPIALSTRLGSQLRRPAAESTPDNKKKAISYAAYRTLLDLFPSEKPRFDALMGTYGYDINDNSIDVTTPQGIGNKSAAVLIAFRHTDGSNQLNGYADTTGYVPINTPTSVVDPSKWQQLQFANGASPGFIAPHWGNVVPFGMTSPSALRPPPPPVYGTPTYLAQAQEVLDVLGQLNDERKVIAEYWADGPKTVLPPGHWQLFGQYVSQRDGHTLDDDVKMFFLLGNAVFDAGIACWDCKRTTNTSRPFTAIRALYAGQQVPSFGGIGNGIQMVDGAQWYPYQSRNFITPPFPEYTSGHSTFSAASAEILKRFTGSDNFGNSVTITPLSSALDPVVPAAPVTLSWPTFTAAADQAGISRLYGGIHFEAADLEGRKCGRLVASAVWDRGMSFINGTAPSRKV